MLFLDTKMKDFEQRATKAEADAERLAASLAQALETHRKELATREAQHAQALHALEDMLRLAKAENEELEATRKKQKRVLVKEVKTLRSELQSLQAE